MSKNIYMQEFSELGYLDKGDVINEAVLSTPVKIDFSFSFNFNEIKLDFYTDILDIEFNSADDNVISISTDITASNLGQILKNSNSLGDVITELAGDYSLILDEELENIQKLLKYDNDKFLLNVFNQMDYSISPIFKKFKTEFYNQ